MSEIIQGSAEWHALRVGKVTASRVADVIAKSRTGYGASRANYMAELIAERLTGEPAEKFQNDAMRWGTDHEPDARIAYEFRTGADVVQVGFVPHPTIEMTGASPDGLVGDRGLVEIKCPSTATHIETLLTGKIAEKYITQMEWQMICAGKDWCDFVSFDPRMPESMRLYIRRIELGDPSYLEKEVRFFLSEIDEKVKALNASYGLAVAA